MKHIKHNGKRFEIKEHTLNLNGQNVIDIRDIEGLENQRDLITLNLNDNKIEKIYGIECLVNLERLFLEQNLLTKIEGLEKLANLKVLSLRKNKIAKIENISHLVNLKDLFLPGNRIKKIEGLDSLINLERLNLSYNRRIRKIEGLENLKNLYSLFLGINKIKSIQNLDNLINLRRLGLSANRICELRGLDNLHNLEHLELQFNNIQEIKNLQMLSNLRILKLSHNYIWEIEGLEGLKISSLDLSNNYIKEVKGLEDLNNLTNLNLQHNPIIDQEEFLLNRDIETIKNQCKKKNQLIKGIIGNGEDERTEYKERYRYDDETHHPNRNLKEKVNQAICAFLNKYGGDLFIGVSNSGDIMGIELDLKTYNEKNERSDNKDSYYQDIMNSIREDLGTKVINLVSIDFIPISNEEIVKITIKRSLDPVFFRESDFYVRIGPSNRKLNPKETIDYIQSQFHYEGTLGYTDFEDEEIESYSSPQIDLALKYIDWFSQDKISFEKQPDRIHFICRQYKILSSKPGTYDDYIEPIQDFIIFAKNILEIIDDNSIVQQINVVLLDFSSRDIIKDYLKTNLFDIFTKLYYEGNRDSNVIGILVNLGYFDDNILNEIDKAIQNIDIEFLISLYYTDLMRFNKNYEVILEKLINFIEDLEYGSNKNLVNKINNLISKLQKIYKYKG